MTRLFIPAFTEEKLLYLVERSEAWYCVIRRDGDGATVQFDEDDSDGTEWREISRYTRVRFRVAFTMFGPEACDVVVI